VFGLKTFDASLLPSEGSPPPTAAIRRYYGRLAPCRIRLDTAAIGSIERNSAPRAELVRKADAVSQNIPVTFIRGRVSTD